VKRASSSRIWGLKFEGAAWDPTTKEQNISPSLDGKAALDGEWRTGIISWDWHTRGCK
jgi:hypothetical protein